MSTALQFTSVFDPTKPPQKLNIGGVKGQTKKFEDITPMGNKKFNIVNMKNLKETKPRFNILDMQEREPKKTTEDKMNMLANKALEARGIKTEAIKDLETPPPVSVADATKPSLPAPRFMDEFENLDEKQKQDMYLFFEQLRMLEQLERLTPNEDLRDEMLKENLQQMYNKMYGETLQAKAMSPDMNMIMRAQNDQSGINSVVNDSPIAQLRMMDYNGKV